MEKIQFFEQFLSTQSIEIPILEFVANLALSMVLAFLLGKLYGRFGVSLSNRESFAENFMLLTPVTMLIISIVKSSLALSLGLVGALSIVRFRAAIKEPEELTFLFLSIGIGLGCGANQGLITIIAFASIAVIVVLKRVYQRKAQPAKDLNLIISVDGPVKLDMLQVANILKTYCTFVDLRRFDETPDVVEASFLIALNSPELLQSLIDDIREYSPNSRVTFLDNNGIPV